MFASLRRRIDLVAAMSGRGAARERAYWSREQTLLLQQSRLGDLVEFATRFSPFYRGLYGGSMKACDVRLEDLPPITKSEMMTHLDRVFTDRRLRRRELEEHMRELGSNDALHLREFRVVQSGGSSGLRGLYVFSRTDWRHMLSAASRVTDYFGLRPSLPRKRIASISAPGAQHASHRFGSAFDVGVFRSLRLSATDPLNNIVEALNRHQPESLQSYASMCARLADEQLAGRLQISPSVVVTASEQRTPAMTEAIVNAWQTRPYDTYATTETGPIAVECEAHAGLHLFEDCVIVELLDRNNRPVAPGQVSDKVWVTNLTSRTQPFIRYEVSDRVTVSDEPCTCGRRSRRLVAIEGRSDDILELPRTGGGTVSVHPIVLRKALEATQILIEYEVVELPHALELRLVPRSGTSKSDVERRAARDVHQALIELGAAPIEVRTLLCSALRRDGISGKRKLIHARRAQPSVGLVAQ